MARNKPRKAEPSTMRTKTYESVDKSIWREEDKHIASWEYIRGSSFCAIRANMPNRFKHYEEEQTNE